MTTDPAQLACDDRAFSGPLSPFPPRLAEVGAEQAGNVVIADPLDMIQNAAGGARTGGEL